MPPAARPPEKVRACSSSMPTSKNLFGNICAKHSSPVPDFMAAVTAHILPSLSAKVQRYLPKTAENVALPFFNALPVCTLNLGTPWKAPGFFSAKEYPLPFWVSTWSRTGCSIFFTLLKTSVRRRMSWPSNGP